MLPPVLAIDATSDGTTILCIVVMSKLFQVAPSSWGGASTGAQSADVNRVSVLGRPVAVTYPCSVASCPNRVPVAPDLVHSLKLGYTGSELCLGMEICYEFRCSWPAMFAQLLRFPLYA